MTTIKFSLGCLYLGLLSGCAFENKSLTHFDENAGYRLQNLHPNARNSDEVFFVLTFSGGGTRAAAFSFGALQELAATPIGYGGVRRRLLDEVDIISSVSGGSFTAAYYALYRDAIFTNFDREFLSRNVQLDLGLRVADPLNWPRLWSPYFDRIDLAAQCYDDLLFKGHTYHDLIANGNRPFVIINATDFSLESQFEFTQEQFDLLYSDLSSYPLARAVAASSAFPFLLSPLTLKNHPDRPGYKEPLWIENGLQDFIDPRFQAATQARSYEDATNRPYIHLLDGGISDNIGLRGPSLSLVSNNGESSILNMINLGQIKKLVFLAVNAKVGINTARDRHRRAPGLIGVLEEVTSAPMDNYSIDTLKSLHDSINQINQDNQTQAQLVELLQQYGITLPATLANVDIDFYPIELDFDQVKDPAVRAHLKAMPTNYHLDSQDVELLERTAREELRDNKVFRKLVEDLK